MTDNQKEYVKRAREEGISLRVIAKSINLPVTTVSSYCVRHSIEPGVIPDRDRCKYCGKTIVSTPGKKKRQFCSRECGLKWWHEHPELIHKKAVYELTCLGCGKSFTSYGAKNCKFCSIECYCQHRGKGACNGT